jgi:hypothetical protein
MQKPSPARSAQPFLFATFLCLLMVGGDIFYGRGKNPMALAFYCFLPVVVWMITSEQQRNAQAIRDLTARLDQLEASLRSSTPAPRE